MELRDADIAGSMASVRRTGREFSFFFFFFSEQNGSFSNGYTFTLLSLQVKQPVRDFL